MALRRADVPTAGWDPREQQVTGDMWTVGRWTRVAVLLLTAVVSAYGEWHGVVSLVVTLHKGASYRSL